MSVIGYARCNSENDARLARHDMRGWCHDHKSDLRDFDFDLKSGKRGLTHTLRALKSGDTLLIRHLSNLGRSQQELLKNANELATKRGVSVVIISSGREFKAGAEQPNTWVLADMLEAHNHYVKENIKSGVEAARAGGALIGRPKRFTLADADAAVAQMRMDGTVPSKRQLAKRLGCSPTTAFSLLQQREPQNAAKRPTNARREPSAALPPNGGRKPLEALLTARAGRSGGQR